MISDFGPCHRIFRGAKVILDVPWFALLAVLALTGTPLARRQVVLLVASRALLFAVVSLVLLTCTTHVPVEIVVPHFVICHFSLPPDVRWLTVRPESTTTTFSGRFNSYAYGYNMRANKTTRVS